MWYFFCSIMGRYTEKKTEHFVLLILHKVLLCLKMDQEKCNKVLTQELRRCLLTWRKRIQAKCRYYWISINVVKPSMCRYHQSKCLFHLISVHMFSFNRIRLHVSFDCSDNTADGNTRDCVVCRNTDHFLMWKSFTLSS